MGTIQQINNNFEAVLSNLGITPGTRDAEFVEALVYVVLPMSNPTLRNRGGQNKELFTITFGGGFMSTCSSTQGRHAVHTSMPFMMWMTDTDHARVYAPAFKSTKRGKDGTKSVWETQLEDIRWSHKVKEGETTRVPVGEKIPYNFRLGFTPQQLSDLGLDGATDPDSVWATVSDVIPTSAPQLHLILGVSLATMESAKVTNVFGQNRYAMQAELKASDVIHVQWVFPDHPMYDHAANIPTMLVDNRSNYERVETKAGASTISVNEVGLSNPDKSMRNLLVKHVNKVGKGGRDVIQAFIAGMDGKLRCWWDKLPATKQSQFLGEWEVLVPKGKAKGAKTAPVVEAQKEAAVTTEVVVTPVVEAQKEAALDFDFSELDALLNIPIEVPAPKPSVKPVATPKVGGNLSAKLSVDNFDDLDEI